MDYEYKYLKYKTKYLELKQKGGITSYTIELLNKKIINLDVGYSITIEYYVKGKLYDTTYIGIYSVIYKNNITKDIKAITLDTSYNSIPKTIIIKKKNDKDKNKSTYPMKIKYLADEGEQFNGYTAKIISYIAPTLVD